MVTYVLVHGGWDGGWCWRDVEPHLRQAGHDVLRPSLTGLGDRVHLRHPGVTMETHVQDVVNMLDGPGAALRADAARRRAGEAGRALALP